MSPIGKSIIIISARSIDDKISRIIPKSDVGSILVPKGYVSYVVSEFANSGKIFEVSADAIDYLKKRKDMQ